MKTYKVLKPFSSIKMGNLVPGQSIELDADVAKQMAGFGLVEYTEQQLEIPVEVKEKKPKKPKIKKPE